uniref:NADH dehydrogenase [ubiquinone] 1 alpha subcomplex assembly factor 2 n=1 Tax=Castor canadensis TaxID=51338 RepID=A0A8C0XEM5_CASCN
MGWSQSLFRTWWRALSKEVKELVGTDHLGNKYYYIPEYKNWRGEVRAWAGGDPQSLTMVIVASLTPRVSETLVP